ncbi:MULTISPECIES: type 1 glutamine amidotransferase [Alphaproteobacteria]|uniref:GMP synthase n=2 Tax=Alphaproteobacteria TaxID=28211 RepID=A0A512HE84_9HYPH|nr:MULTISPECIES: type 1 glutamine amidotransferase [Alphaproteobacteria]GEO83768.1 GMP synthase [Ciceribacter naphthalenivorans]GLR24080.1 GMP synthase [Ciceribacter naphthalenivorans]GLT06936.1 GMP synthase [Sphingomonas psychrolutea]
MRVAIIENTRYSDPGQVGVALAEAGAQVEVIRAYAGEALPGSPDTHDALVVFGGEQNARDDDKHPYLPQLAALMRAYGEADKAVLGICLGSQLLARGFGGDNLIGAAPEFGWQTIEPTAAGLADPVLVAAGARPFLSFQWHDDTFSLPPDAVHLAGNQSARHQAFRVGRAAYGMQFHFEAHRGVVETWNALFPDLVERKQPGWLARHPEYAATQGAQADAAGLAIARAWVALI